MNTPTLIPLNNAAALQQAGIIYPATENAWRWLYRQREERGLSAAFVRMGRRVLVDVPRFIELARSRPNHV
jgi:hypothetical protein